MDQPSFAQMSAPNRFINEAVREARTSASGWQERALESLNRVADTEWGRLFLRESPSFQKPYDRLQAALVEDAERIVLTRELEELYTFSSLINRTRRRDIGEFTSRKPETFAIPFTPAQQDLHDRLLGIVARILGLWHGQQSVKFMMTTIRRQASSCLYGLAPLLDGILAGNLDRLEAMEAADHDAEIDLQLLEPIRQDIESLLALARRLDPVDPKAQAFIQVLRDKSQLPNSKALVFSTFRHTLAYLAKHCQEAGLRFGLVHGGVPEEERAELRRRFALAREDEGGIDVLLSSEVGCEGLDFQFCDLLINYDLPWNPMRIEQRIGRIDRYGQKSPTVAIANFITPGTVDADIYSRCLLRIGVFNHAVGGSEEILGEITESLHDIADSFQLTDTEREGRLRQLADNSIRILKEQEDLEAREAELLGLRIPSSADRESLAAATSFWLSPDSLRRCVLAYLADRGAESVTRSMATRGVAVLKLEEEDRRRLLKDLGQLPKTADPLARQWEKWLRGSASSLTVTFDKEVAAEMPTVTHISAAHPLVRQAARHQRQAETLTVFATCQSDDVPAGVHPFGLYEWNFKGVKTRNTIVAVTVDPSIEPVLMGLLERASNVAGHTAPAVDVDLIETRHHAKWLGARADHVEENSLLVEHRVQSLTASHRARVQTLDGQISSSKNAKIAVMRRSELARANQEYAMRLDELQNAANSGDIHATLIAVGALEVRAPERV